MNADASDILRDRMVEPAGLQRMAAVSVAVHVAALALVLLAPGGVFRRNETPRTVMTITLGGGAPGPQNGGMTAIAGRAVQTEVPPDAPKRPEPIRPPAAAKPEMVLPPPKAAPRVASQPVVKQAPTDARGRTPTRGAQISPGDAVAETGARGQGFGLSTGGGAGSGSRLDVADFCCPDYLVVMVERIRTNWKAQAEVPGEAVVKFTIQRDGTLTDVIVEKSSGYSALDINAQRALVGTRQLPALPAAFPNPTLTVHLNFQYHPMMHTSIKATLAAILVTTAAGVLLTAGGGRQQSPPQQPGEVSTTISSGETGSAPRFAVPDFIALSNDAETVDAAKTIGRVLWDDLAFEREFALLPRDTYASIPPATSITNVPFDRWRELNADGVVVGTVQKVENGVRVEVRLFNVRSRQAAFSKEYSGSVANKRLYAHTIADEIHQQQRALRGVARTKLTFNSDRSGERMSGTVEARSVKEVFIGDYDGENQRQITTNRSLNINSAWSPDARSIAYTSFRNGAPNIFIANIYQGTNEELTKGPGQSVTPVWSPDGTRLAFASTRDGNFELYVANRDGSNVRRLTNHPGADITPTWSPSGTQIAFTSDRTGSPQIFVVGVDGLGLRQVTHESYADRPTWSPAPYNEIAFAARTGPGFDVRILELATGQVRQLTFGEGTNESPAFSPNGRHVAFSSTRSGKSQIFTIARDGRDLRQVTRLGNNFQPDWSK